MLTLIPLSIMFVGAEFSTLKILSCLISMPFMIIVAYMGIRLFMWLRDDDDAGLLDKFRVKRKKPVAAQTENDSAV